MYGRAKHRFSFSERALSFGESKEWLHKTVENVRFAELSFKKSQPQVNLICHNPPDTGRL